MDRIGLPVDYSQLYSGVVPHDLFAGLTPHIPFKLVQSERKQGNRGTSCGGRRERDENKVAHQRERWSTKFHNAPLHSGGWWLHTTP